VPPSGAQPLQSALAQPLSPLRGDEIFKGVKKFFSIHGKLKQ